MATFTVTPRPTKKPLFIGYAVFYDGKLFECSVQTVTKDKVYLWAHALYKLNRMSKEALQDMRNVNVSNWAKVQFRKHPNLSLRRVYVH